MMTPRILVCVLALGVAITGAFATAIRSGHLIYNISNNDMSCIGKEVEFSCPPGEHTCVMFIDAINGAKLMYGSDIPSVDHPCSVELSRE